MLKRVQPDLVEEIEQCEGATFSAKLREWKTQEVQKQVLETFDMIDRNPMLTKEDVREAVEEALPSGVYK